VGAMRETVDGVKMGKNEEKRKKRQKLLNIVFFAFSDIDQNSE
jgi:hypothetical protein